MLFRSNDVFNRANQKYLSGFDQPQIFNVSLNYTVPAWKSGKGLALKTASWVLRDWTLGTFLNYSSGLPIAAPAAQNQLATLLFRGTFANRVAGQPLFSQDLNCHCFDPNKDFVLNPSAWSQPAAGQWGTSAAYYNDYRFQRRPSENMAFGRTFRVKERATLNVRLEFNNIFNRMRLPNPSVAGNFATAPTKFTTGTSTGLYSGGFGTYSVLSGLLGLMIGGRNLPLSASK